MRISDWSSDVCSSDLAQLFQRGHRAVQRRGNAAADQVAEAEAVRQYGTGEAEDKGGALVEQGVDVVDEHAGRHHPVPPRVLGRKIKLHRVVLFGAGPAPERLGVSIKIGVRFFSGQESLVVLAGYGILLLHHVLSDLLMAGGMRDQNAIGIHDEKVVLAVEVQDRKSTRERV